MATPYIGQIKLVAFNFAPKGYAFCNGQILAINQNTALFSILGTTYGGNGTTTFALPNLQGCVAVSSGQGPGLSSYNLGQVGGSQNVTLATNQTAHTHSVKASSTANSNAASGNFPGPAPAGGDNIYGGSTDTAMHPQVAGQSGGGQPHSNMQPYTVLNYVIALTGVFPTRN
jgi:microcystin-dependent protein